MFHQANDQDFQYMQKGSPFTDDPFPRNVARDAGGLLLDQLEHLGPDAADFAHEVVR